MANDFSKLKEKWAHERSERRHRSEQMKSALIEKGVPVLQKYGVHKVILFGSVLDENCIESSDVDVLALPVPNNLYWQCLHDLQQAVEFPVDLYTQTDETSFVKKILSRGEVIYDAQS